jgi:hypothetical protein
MLKYQKNYKLTTLKINKMKKSYFIMLMALMCMFSCRTENTSDILSDQTHKSKFDASFKEVLQATKSPDESSLMAKVQDFTEDYNPSDFIIDTAKIKKTLKNGEVTEYAIYLKKKTKLKSESFTIWYLLKDRQLEKIFSKIYSCYYS